MIPSQTQKMFCAHIVYQTLRCMRYRSSLQRMSAMGQACQSFTVRYRMSKWERRAQSNAEKDGITSLKNDPAVQSLCAGLLTYLRQQVFVIVHLAAGDTTQQAGKVILSLNSIVPENLELA